MPLAWRLTEARNSSTLTCDGVSVPLGKIMGRFGRSICALLLGLVLGAGGAAAQERTLRVGINGADIGQIDPHRAQATQDRILASWMFNALVRFPPGSADPAAIEADLAERWEASADGLTWTFHLRRGVMFHGEWGELTAEDVRYSLMRAADPQRSSFAGEFRALDRVDAVDPYTVRVVFRGPVPSVLGLLSNYQGGFIVSRRADTEMGAAFRTRPVGTGPFAFAEHVTLRHVILRAHERYHRGRPQIDRIEYRFIPSDATRELAYTAGEVDLFIGRRDQRWVERMRAAPNTVVDIFRPAEYRTLHLNTRIAPLDDRRVREAVARAINVQQIVQFVGADVAIPGRSVVPPGSLGETGDGWAYAHDVARARALLAEAGHPNGITIRAVVSNISTQHPIMELIQAQLRRAGITLDMSVVDHATYHAQIRQDLSQITFYGAARFPVADAYLNEFYHSRARIGTPTAALNLSHCTVADADIEAAQTTDQARQIAAWQAAQRRIHEAICAIPLFDLMQVWVRSARLDLGYTLTGAMNLSPMLTEATRLR